MIKLSDISKTYSIGSESITALSIEELSIATGQWVSITGPSGSGKSTLLNIIGCLDIPSTGSYELMGAQTERLTPSQLAHVRNTQLSFIFQRFHLLSTLTAAQNVALPLQYSGTPQEEIVFRVQSYLETVGLADRADHYPHQLSGGQQQRVAIARALATQAPLLLADEPTGSLDSKTGMLILELLEQLYQEHSLTIVLVTHDPIVAKRGNRHIQMRDGAIQSDRSK